MLLLTEDFIPEWTCQPGPSQVYSPLGRELVSREHPICGGGGCGRSLGRAAAQGSGGGCGKAPSEFS